MYSFSLVQLECCKGELSTFLRSIIQMLVLYGFNIFV
jgi:hypothetical protein